MDEPSVMASENALMAAALTPGTTVIGNAACEPHVQDLARMLVKMGADIQGIGSNLITVNGAKELHGCEHEVAPDHIEIGSFIALAGVTGGELRIKDTVPGDLRMIRLVFERLGLRTELDGNDVLVPGGAEADRAGGCGRVQVKDPGRPVAGVSGRSDLDRGGARDPGRGVDPRARVDVREPPDLHRQADPDGRGHRDVRPAPRDRHRARDGCAASAWSRRTSGRGWRCCWRRCARRASSEIGNIRQIDRGYERIDERLRELGARIERVAIEPVPA